MSPLYRIAQLTSQLADAREQAARDSATIARLHARNEDLVELLNAILLWEEADMRRTPPPKGSMAAHFLPAFCRNARAAIARNEGVTA